MEKDKELERDEELDQSEETEEAQEELDEVPEVDDSEEEAEDDMETDTDEDDTPKKEKKVKKPKSGKSIKLNGSQILCIVGAVCLVISLAVFAVTFFTSDSYTALKEKDVPLFVDSDTDAMIERAVEELKSEWDKYYDEKSVADRYLEIKNTRVIKLKEELPTNFNNILGYQNMHDDYAYIIEFNIYTNNKETAPYYNSNTEDVGCAVLVAKSGKCVVVKDLLNAYSARYYNYDYSKIIESLTDYGNKYNGIYHLEEE